MSVMIDLSMTCFGCGTYVNECPTGALGLDDEDHVELQDPLRCGECGCCVDACPSGVLTLVEELS